MEVTCLDKNHLLKGNSKVTCIQGTQFSGDIPRCVPVRGNFNSFLSSGQITSGKYADGYWRARLWDFGW